MTGKKGIIVAVAVVAVVALAAVAASTYLGRRPSATARRVDAFANNIPNISMRLESPAFQQNEAIPVDYTCDGRNISPALVFKGLPEEAKSLALICDDPDAPAGTWVHWVVWNIVPTAAFIPEGKLPAGAVEGLTSFGRTGYGGPCPPSGTHRYFFKAYALDTTLNLSPDTDAGALEKAMIGHVIDKAGLVGTYGR